MSAQKATRRTRGLGRGLSALISDSETSAATENTAEPRETSSGATMIAVDRIRENPSQPRDRFNPERLGDLVESVRRHGVLQPLMVRARDNHYELIAGERRLRAAREAGLLEVPASIREVSDEQSLELALVENLQREDLNPIEEADGYQDLINRFGLTQEHVAQRVGKARASVANSLRLLSLNDDVRMMLADGRLSTGHAKVLLGVHEPERQRLLAMRSVSEHLSVRQLERLAAGPRRHMQRIPGKAPASLLPADYLRQLTDVMQRHFGTAVRITPAGISSNGRKSKGRIELDFHSNEELQRLLELMGLNDSL